MKILLINKYHYLESGATRCYFDTARILKEAGHEVAFFAMDDKRSKKTIWSKYFAPNYSYEDNQTILRKIVLAFNILYNFSAKKRLGRLLKEFKPDVAHLHNIYHQLSPSVIDVLKKNNIPMLMTLHDYKLICPNYSLYAHGNIWEKSKKNKYYKCFFDKCFKNSYVKSFWAMIEAYLHNCILKSYEKVDVFVSPSRFLIDKFKEFGFKKKIVHIPNPLFVDDIKKEENKTDNYILYFGRLSGEKGVDMLIKSFVDIKTDCKLKIAGTGNEEDSLKELAGDNPRIEFLGWKETEELKDIIAKSLFVVAPSRWYENAPYSVLEPMSQAKLVLASELGGHKEIISDNKTGFLFDPYKEGDLKLKIENILNSKERLPEIGEKAKSFVKNNNNVNNYRKELEAVYNSIK